MRTDRGDRPIVVTGEALIDLVLTPDGGVSAHPGGGPYNVARTIARLDRPVAYLGRISSDPFGDRLRDQLADDGVDLGAVVATDTLTTLALAQVDSAGVARYRFCDGGAGRPHRHVLRRHARPGLGPAGVDAGDTRLASRPGDAPRA